MRLTGGSDDEPLTEAWAYLTAAEAIDLFHALRAACLRVFTSA
jgi:hypothetical protein